MRIPRPLAFLFNSITIGLAAAFVVLVLRPDLLDRAPVVEIKQAPDTATVASAPPASYADAVALAAPAVVNIYTAKVVIERVRAFAGNPILQRFFGDLRTVPKKRIARSLGSGVIISQQGYILTNYHVIKDADLIRVDLSDGRIREAHIVGSDPDTDLGILKIEADDLPSIAIGQSEKLRVGDIVLAIGNPFGVGQTVTQGIVSATGRNQLGISTFENFIQTDAAINPGNSGGALINARGYLIGINSAIRTESGGSNGIGFAIPVSLARNVMRQIIEHGHVIRGWLGIEMQELTPQLAESFGLKNTDGVLLSGIIENGPADAAGMKLGDVIIKIDGKPIMGSDDVLMMTSNHEPGTRMSVTIIRQGQEKTVEPMVLQRPRTIKVR